MGRASGAATVERHYNFAVVYPVASKIANARLEVLLVLKHRLKEKSNCPDSRIEHDYHEVNLSLVSQLIKQNKNNSLCLLMF